MHLLGHTGTPSRRAARRLEGYRIAARRTVVCTKVLRSAPESAHGYGGASEAEYAWLRSIARRDTEVVHRGVGFSTHGVSVTVLR